ncbi:hypothetical protein VQ042_15055 [Aurantimonas sp. A2-1-M11]|uniref:iron-sulfur cluster-binding protein n=1 Tax=Aurantimonas sp. A2-1-M11 TaxID=3113712 RepID=UPI002F947F58
MAPLVRFARNNGHRVTAVLSARSPNLLMSVDEMRRDGATVRTVTDTDADGTSALANVAAILEACHAQGQMGALYVCGSNRLMQAAQEIARRHGLYGEAALEQQMACGLGMCFCCVRPFREGASIVHRRVCSDGPVFPLADAITW